MRIAFVETLIELAEKDKNVWLVTGDLGFNVFEGFIKKFPDQYLNVGVAEQNMIGVAAGLALSGKKVFAYSISTFASMRAYEQVRNDVCYQNLPVFIIGGGSTFSYSTFGCTHFPLEDLAIMRALPNMRVLCPGDAMEVRALMNGLCNRPSPAYMRIAKRGEPVVHADIHGIELGKASLLADGSDVTLAVAGKQLPNAIEARRLLAEKGISARVLSFHTLKPFDKEAIMKAARETKVIASLEEHSVIGGLGGVIAETLAQERGNATLVFMGVPDEFPKGVGKELWFLKRYDLTPEGIAGAVMKKLKL